MIQNETVRIWVNRVVAFLAGGLVLFIFFQIAVVGVIEGQNKELKKELDEIQFEPGRLLEQGKAYLEKNEYEEAKRILNTLFKEHPSVKETIEGKTLYAEIEKQQEEMNKKWNAAVTGIRQEWEKTRAAQLKDQIEKERNESIKNMENNLNREWESTKDQIRKEWEKQI